MTIEDVVQERRLWTGRFIFTLLSGFSFFVSFGSVFTVLPPFVTEELRLGEAAVGLVFGSYALSAIALRPLIGWLGDRYGQRSLVIGGGFISAIGMLLHLPSTSIEQLVLARLIVGVGQAASWVGVTALAMNQASKWRQGEAASFAFMAVQLGIGIGPLLGEQLLRSGSYAAAWIGAAAGALLSSMFALAAPAGDKTSGAVFDLRSVVEPSGFTPGVVAGLGIVGYVGFLAFIPLYAIEIGLDRAAGPLFVSAATMALIRAFGGRLPDRFGPLRTGAWALVTMGGGLIGLGVWQSPSGLYLSTVAMSLGAAMHLPSFIVMTNRLAPPSRRGRAVGTFSALVDSGVAVGPLALGILAATHGYGFTFVVTGLFAWLCAVAAWVWIGPWYRANVAKLR